MVNVNLKLKAGPLLFNLTILKIRKAIGLTSFVPNNPQKHWLLCDWDEKPHKGWINHCDIFYKTPHGYHGIKFSPHTLTETAQILLEWECDINHVALGLKRGYWFLENWKPIPPKYWHKCVFMEIERNAT